MKSNGIWGVIAIFSFYTNGSELESLNKKNGKYVFLRFEIYLCKVERDNRNKTTIKRTVGVCYGLTHMARTDFEKRVS